MLQVCQCFTYQCKLITCSITHAERFLIPAGMLMEAPFTGPARASPVQICPLNFCHMQPHSLLFSPGGGLVPSMMYKEVMEPPKLESLTYKEDDFCALFSMSDGTSLCWATTWCGAAGAAAGRGCGGASWGFNRCQHLTLPPWHAVYILSAAKKMSDIGSECDLHPDGPPMSTIHTLTSLPYLLLPPWSACLLGA